MCKHLESMTVQAPTQHAHALRAAAAANVELSAAAALLGVSATSLIVCLAKQVGWAKLLVAATTGGSVIAALGTAIDWDGVVKCVTGALEEFS